MELTTLVVYWFWEAEASHECQEDRHWKSSSLWSAAGKAVTRRLSEVMPSRLLMLMLNIISVVCQSQPTTRNQKSSPNDDCPAFYTSLISPLSSLRASPAVQSRRSPQQYISAEEIRRIFAYKHAARCRCITKTAIDSDNRLPRTTRLAAFGTPDGGFLPLRDSSMQGALGQDPWSMYKLMPCLFDNLENCRQLSLFAFVSATAHSLR